jgi:hypothetical protein
MRKTLKILHSLGAAGLTGAVLVHLVLLYTLPATTELAEYAAVRSGIALVTQWVLLPSLAVMLVSGLLAIAAHTPFGNFAWVWLKFALTLSIFQPILMWIHGPAHREAEAAMALLADASADVRLEGASAIEQGMLWVTLATCVANVVLAIWRPRFQRRMAAATLAQPARNNPRG